MKKKFLLPLPFPLPLSLPIDLPLSLPLPTPARTTTYITAPTQHQTHGPYNAGKRVIFANVELFALGIESVSNFKHSIFVLKSSVVRAFKNQKHIYNYIFRIEYIRTLWNTVLQTSIRVTCIHSLLCIFLHDIIQRAVNSRYITNRPCSAFLHQLLALHITPPIYQLCACRIKMFLQVSCEVPAHNPAVQGKRKVHMKREHKVHLRPRLSVK